MQQQASNPIYDAVFKYLMEDEHIARTILSALLKEKVVRVKDRRDEKINKQFDSITVFRMDFAATIEKDNGEEETVLVELQKNWVPTETLCFRQYLGAQYSNPDNVIGYGSSGHALPMVAIYLLGHRVGDIQEPVIYVDHQVKDYDGHLVTEGIPDPFVSSLTHNSIIVQIPLLHGRVNSRLERVLTIFDQTRLYSGNRHLINIDDDEFPDDPEMQHVVRRLFKAAASATIRKEMDDEDVYISVLEENKTELMKVRKELAKKEAKIDEQASMLRTSIRMFLDSGKTVSEIAKCLGKSEDVIRMLSQDSQDY
ncbi:MAG: hypothetical protein IKH32_08395 [Prevotella sp.]|nr:hypothetical protein [Prevotella sp.]